MKHVLLQSFGKEVITPNRYSLDGFTIIRILLGMLLLAAAGFKAYAVWIDPNPVITIFSSPRWQVAFIELETVLGLWLLAGVYPSVGWLAALEAFSLFGTSSLYLAIVGQPSCGCFGKVSVSPLYAFALDVMAVVALAYWRPSRRSLPALLRESWQRFLRPSRRRLI